MLRNLRFLGDHTQLGEQLAQRRVGAVVVHEERRVDTDVGAVAAVDEVGVGMSAQPGGRLIKGDAVAAGQGERGGQASDTAADYRN
jgi:hypothetical protein